MQDNITTIASVMNIKTKPTTLPREYRTWFYHLPYDKPFVLSISGDAFAGKSSFMLKLMSKLCQPNVGNTKGDKCLYINIEEPLHRGATIQEKCRNMKLPPSALKNIDIISNPDLNTIEEIIKILDSKEYKYCVIDSISMMCGNSQKKHFEVWEFIQNRKESFFCVLHADKNKKEKMKGAGIWQYHPDICVWLHRTPNGTYAEFKKNRYHHGKLTNFDTYNEKVITDVF